MAAMGRHQLENEQDAGRGARLRRGARRLRAGLRQARSSPSSFRPSLPCARSSERSPTTGVKVGAQNMHWADAGAWTGEVSPVMLKDCGLDLVELGHSERREHFGETDETVGLKTAAALSGTA